MGIEPLFTKQTLPKLQITPSQSDRVKMEGRSVDTAKMGFNPPFAVAALRCFHFDFYHHAFTNLR